MSLNKAKQHNQSLALLFLDVNRFKHINDTLGHHLGDLVLQKFSALLSDSLFAQSIVSRISGDEFVIVYPFGNQMSAAMQAVKIIQQLEAPFSKSMGVMFLFPPVLVSHCIRSMEKIPRFY